MATYPTVELYVNSTWTDITQYVRCSNMIEISRGTSGEGSLADTSTCRMTLENTDGRFSPRNPTGPYYGQIGRNTPIRVSVDGGETYLDCPGAAGDRSSTPDHADLDITGDIDVRIELSVKDWDSDDVQELIGKYNITGNQRSWRLLINADGAPEYSWSADGINIAGTVTASNTIVNRGVRRVAIRVTHDVNDGSGNNVVTFYTADSVNATSWRQLGTITTTAGTTSIFASTATLDIADIQNLSFDPLIGRVHRAQVRNGIDGTVVANPDFTNQTVGAASFVDSAGRTWTMAGNASIKNRKERFTGEVASWPPTSDISGQDKTVAIEASGILRRLSQGSDPLQSALTRFVKAESLIHECWTLTDGNLSTYGEPLHDGSRMRLRTITGTNSPNWGGGSLAEWLEPVIQLPTEHRGELRGYVPNETLAATAWSVDFCYAGIKDFEFLVADRSDGSDTDPVIQFRLNLDKANDRIQLYSISIGETTSSTTLQATISNAGVFDGISHAIRLSITNSGSDANFNVYIDGVSETSGAATGLAVNSLRYVQPQWDYSAVTTDTPSIGFISFTTSGGPSAFEYRTAMLGHRNETAADRMARLCEEEGILFYKYGDDSTNAMRPQGMAPLVDLLRECEAADLGILYEPRDDVALAYRDRASMENQSAAMALTYSDHELSNSLAPVEDDRNTRNDVTVTQLYGNSYRVTLDSGALSTLAPPNGVGRYATSVTASLNDDRDPPSYASWLVHLGTVDEARYPTMGLNLRHTTFTSSASMMEDALMLDVGDRLTVDGVPSWWPPDTISQLSVGFSERLGFVERDIVINCSPESPYHTAKTSGDYDRADTDGCTIIEDLTTTETDVTVLTQIGSAGWITTADYSTQFPFNVRAGGETMSVTACTGAIEDDFSTNQVDSWGSADVGGTWTNNGGTVGGDYDVTGGVGTHTLTSVNVARRSYLTAPSASFEILCDIATSALATGASLTGAVMARMLDVDNMYMARLEFTTAQAVVLSIRERVSGVEASLGSVTTNLTHAAGTYVRVRFRGSGTALKAKAWQVGSTEPNWQVEVTDGSITAANSIGCRSLAETGNTNVNPTVNYDNFKLINPQILTVTRSQNSVVKSHSSGADIRLATPAYVPF